MAVGLGDDVGVGDEALPGPADPEDGAGPGTRLDLPQHPPHGKGRGNTPQGPKHPGLHPAAVDR
jgi:hypothetical protein